VYLEEVGREGGEGRREFEATEITCCVLLVSQREERLIRGVGPPREEDTGRTRSSPPAVAEGDTHQAPWRRMETAPIGTEDPPTMNLMYLRVHAWEGSEITRGMGEGRH
jgi:hypothetical protein